MSNKDPKDSEVEESAAPLENESTIEDAEIIEQSSPTKSTSEASNNSPSRLPLILAVVALLGVVVAGTIGYQQWKILQVGLKQVDQTVADGTQQQQQLQAKLGSLETAFKAQKSQIDQQRAALADQANKLTAERKRLDQQAAEMQQTLKSVYARMGRNNNAWMAAEAEYLMRVANHRLQLERDVNTAAQALQAADDRLRQTGDPGWIKVREVLAAEIASLKAVSRPDVAGLSARLSGLAGQVERLKMMGLQYTPATAEQPADAADEKGRSFKTLLKDGWEGFKSVMVIRHRDKPVSAMLAPEEQFFIYKNLQLQLQTARLALLKGEPALFVGSLEQASAWIGEFFDPEAASTQAIQQALAELKKAELRPQLPDITQSLSALQQRMRQIEDEGAQ